MDRPLKRVESQDGLICRAHHGVEGRSHCLTFLHAFSSDACFWDLSRPMSGWFTSASSQNQTLYHMGRKDIPALPSLGDLDRGAPHPSLPHLLQDQITVLLPFQEGLRPPSLPSSSIEQCEVEVVYSNLTTPDR